MSQRPSAEEIIAHLQLAPLPGEGGYFRETYRQDDPEHPDSPRATAILYFITPDEFSTLHRLTADEMFHFYFGDPCIMTLVDPHGAVRQVTLGPDVLNGQTPQQLVPAGWWQANRLAPGGEMALFGTTMTPGFTSSGFELATQEHVQEFASPDRELLEPLLSQDVSGSP